MKKFFIPMMALCLASSAMAQIKVDIKGVAPKGAKYIVLHTQEAHDTIPVKSGKFSISREVKTVDFANLLADNEAAIDLMPIITDGTPIDINLQTRTINKGSKDNKDYSVLLKEINPTLHSIYNAFQTMLTMQRQKNEDFPDSLKTQLRKDVKTLGAFTDKVVKEYPNTIIPASFICSFQPFQQIAGQSIEPYLADESRPYMKCEALKPVIQNIKDKAEAAKNPRAAVNPEASIDNNDFLIPDMAGKQHKLTEFVGKGKYVLVDFWASWCGPCRAEMPNVKKAYEKYHPKGFEIVGISFDDKETAWKKAVDELAMPWTQLSNLQGFDCAIGRAYKINGIPFTLLFDPEGNLIGKNLRGSMLQAKLAEIYGE